MAPCLRYLAVLILTSIAAALAVARPASADDAAALDFFEKKVRPVLVNNCYNCHSADTNSKGGLRVDDRNGLINGGGRGPAVVPGDPEASLLLRAVRQENAKLSMPPKKRLSDEQIADLTKWIKEGAAWPQVRLPASLGHPPAKYARLRKQHWAWQPLRKTEVPDAADPSWPRCDVDRYILAQLLQRGLRPVGDADRITLLRRVTFDLTGLPPKPVEIDVFLRDTSANAFEKVVDRLLSSPAFGERWGRHWLDVARYGESTGSARNLPYPHAWRYRDYVVDTFNKDKPYDRFIREQIAGDLLPAESKAQRDEQLIATGFLALGVKDVNQRFKVRFVMDNIDEQIDTIGRALLGLTVSCARCHDHKFDPIPTTDYYALAGIFYSTDLCAGLRNKMGGGGLDYYDPKMLLHVGSPSAAEPAAAQKIAQARKALAQARAEFQAIFGKPEGKVIGEDGRPKQMIARMKMNRLQNELALLNDPASNSPVALGVRDAKVIGDTQVRIRGEAEKLGPTVSRGFLSLLDVPDAPKINAKQSGRLELAEWLTSDSNPLPARVMVNRVWHHLFGQGLVSSVDNFGTTGDAPSHPDLLDYLAARFNREGWSVKKMVRSLVLSRTYQLASATPSSHVAVDPANHLVWRHSPRRLTAEEIRDAMLAVGANLDRARPAGCVGHQLLVRELPNNGPIAKQLAQEAAQSRHRSVYLPLLRTLVPPVLEVFDFAEQGLVTGKRDTTTVAPQALYLMNDPFVRQQALALARRLLGRTDLDDARRINLAYRLTLGRPATARDVDRVIAYIADIKETAASQARAVKGPTPRMEAWGSFCQVMLASAEFRYVR
jgi:cytochrome c553